MKWKCIRPEEAPSPLGSPKSRGAAPNDGFPMLLLQAAQFTEAYTAAGRTVRLQRQAGKPLRVAGPLNIADA